MSVASYYLEFRDESRKAFTVTSDARDARLRDERRVTNVPVTNVSVTKVVKPFWSYHETRLVWTGFKIAVRLKVLTHNNTRLYTTYNR